MNFNLLDAGAATAYSGLTFPLFYKALAKVSATGPTIAVGYQAFGTPMGLIIAHMDENKGAEILSIFVDKCCRNRGVATALLERMEAELLRCGCRNLHVCYKRDSANVPVLERILNKTGWGAPRPYLLTCKVQGKENVDGLMKADWMNGHRLTPEFELFPWQEATKEDHARAGEIAGKLYVADGVSFIEDSIFDPLKFDPLNSLGLRHKGSVIGCMLTQRIGEGMMRYDNMFVAQEYLRSDKGIVMTAEAIKRQYAVDKDSPTVGAVWRSRVKNVPMIRFIKRRLGPYLTSVMETNEAVKQLTK